MAQQNDKRPDNREVENENLRPPAREGEPPRPATEPPGAGDSQRGEETVTDPGSGAPLTPANGSNRRSRG